MALIIKEIRLEVSKPNFIQAIVAKQNDCNSRFLKASLWDEGTQIPIRASAEVTINAERKDGASDSFFGEVNDDNTVTVPLHSWMLELEGSVNCDVSIFVEGRRLTTTSFVVAVEKASNNSDDISTDPQYDVLTDLIEEVNKIQESYPITDQTYDPQSENAQSGIAMEEALKPIRSDIDILCNNIEIKSWKDVQDIVRSGTATKYFEIGDQFTTTWGGQTLIWDVIGIDHDTPANSEYKHSLTIQVHDCIGAEIFQYDAEGSNDWLKSDIRQWLNSEGGFLSGLDAEFLSTVGKVSKITARSIEAGGSYDTSTEKFFLLSRTEVYGGANNNIKEGTPYSYYKDNSTLSAPSEEQDVVRIKYRNKEALRWWLRSPATTNSYGAKFVYYAGEISGSITSNYLGVAPACCIV